MSDDKRIEAYLRDLGAALRQLPEKDRADIVSEIRAHLEHRASEGRLEEAIRALGAPAQCARGFLEELKIQNAFADGGAAKSFGALFELASRRVTAAAGLFVSGIFYLFAIAFAFIAVAKIAAPESVGLWVDPARDIVALGIVDIGENPPEELLGFWMIPFAAIMAVLSLLAGQWLARIFIRLMAKRPSAAV
ncbi:DUF1700 domain-containing protein [Hyphococcus sp.]|jgi:hypothetical protein|uniref:DUF1700 domain-containing protein n=1 Tax=Hyphococcus sp. TaxID=2038636 RepID=UPI003D0BB795